MKEKERKKKIK